MKVFQIGSSLTKDNPNDFDLLVVSDIPVDICVYTEEQWMRFNDNGGSDEGHRIVVHPPKRKSYPEMVELLREQ